MIDMVIIGSMVFAVLLGLSLGLFTARPFGRGWRFWR